MLDRFNKLQTWKKVIYALATIIVLFACLQGIRQILFDICFSQYGAGLSDNNALVCRDANGFNHYSVWD